MDRFSNQNVAKFLEENLESRKTKQSTEFCVRIFQDFCANRGETGDFAEFDLDKLCTLLSDFYANVRSTTGKFYSRSSIVAIRHGINRHLKWKGKQIDIVKDTLFMQANRVFVSMLKKTREVGKGHIDHKPVVTSSDLKKLYESDVFNTNTPHGLLHKVWFELQLYFCRRGRENMRELKVTDFRVMLGDSGQEYIKKITSEKTKNHQGTENAEDFSGGIMLSTGKYYTDLSVPYST